MLPQRSTHPLNRKTSRSRPLSEANVRTNRGFAPLRARQRSKSPNQSKNHPVHGPSTGQISQPNEEPPRPRTLNGANLPTKRRTTPSTDPQRGKSPNQTKNHPAHGPSTGQIPQPIEEPPRPRTLNGANLPTNRRIAPLMPTQHGLRTVLWNQSAYNTIVEHNR